MAMTLMAPLYIIVIVFVRSFSVTLSSIWIYTNERTDGRTDGKTDILRDVRTDGQNMFWIFIFVVHSCVVVGCVFFFRFLLLLYFMLFIIIFSCFVFIYSKSWKVMSVSQLCVVISTCSSYDTLWLFVSLSLACHSAVESFFFYMEIFVVYFLYNNLVF